MDLIELLSIEKKGAIFFGNEHVSNNNNTYYGTPQTLTQSLIHKDELLKQKDELIKQKDSEIATLKALVEALSN